MVASKWDIAKVGIEDLRPRFEDRLKQRPPLVAVSAKTGRGIGRLLDRIEELYDKHTSRVTTGELNRFSASARRASRRPRTESGSTCSTAPRRRCGRRASASSSTTPA